MKEFIFAALPFVAIAICLAVIFANHKKTKENEEAKKGNYMTTGMCIGMCLGLAVSTALKIDMSIGLSIGMLTGMTIGLLIERPSEE